MEDDIFKRRRTFELQFRQRNAKNDFYRKRNQNPNRYEQAHSHTAQRPDMNNRSNHVSKIDRDLNNMEAATNLKHVLTPIDAVPKKKSKLDEDEVEKKADEDDNSNLSEHEKQDKLDDVRLWEEGFRTRYYSSKFSVDISIYNDFPQTVAYEYLRGLCWVLAYYYQGCASWNWYYPYHYAPFASDFAEIKDGEVKFTEKTHPFKPLQQLMSVFPAASRSHVPPSWQDLMTDPFSPIIDFYPIDFRIDLNGKRHAWMGVALLPFVEEKRLLKALNSRIDSLQPEEVNRNKRGSDKYFVHESHKVAKFIKICYEDYGALNLVADEDYDDFPEQSKEIPTECTHGLAGIIWTQDGGIVYRPEEVVPSPFTNSCPSIPANKQNVIGCCYLDPHFAHSHKFPARILDKAKIPAKVNLQPPVRGRGNFVGIRGSRGETAGGRMIENHLGRDYHQNHGNEGGRGRGGHHGQRYDNYNNNNSYGRDDYNHRQNRRENFNSYEQNYGRQDFYNGNSRHNTYNYDNYSDARPHEGYRRGGGGNRSYGNNLNGRRRGGRSYY